MNGKNKMPCRRELKRSILGILIYSITFLLLFLGLFAGYPAFVHDHALWALFATAVIVIFAGPLVSSYLVCLFRYNQQHDKKPWRNS